MWSWERERRRLSREGEVQLGRITLTGEQAAADLGGERRWLGLCAPGGVQWRPREGQPVLVLRPGDGEQPCILGTVEEFELEPGQLRLTGGRCAILLGDRMEILGDMAVNGEGLEDYIRRLIREEME